ncbi:MAG: DUF4491 family protein [Paludibacter sp.]|nr:DUF4491 family protein [Bacteroidales bacterium]MCM1068767.1 DUF4491 family protein [Prevotella sp.]MCM1354479.1 DUF4491 family protein [Bacteroides sp.]MCM1443282.1 DUF4491 family protein [Muribaculum sp.]MCM1481033.1 DUF4491 family protein [Paludibacter sp.]
MSFNGLLIGAATFLCIGMFHPIVIKAEYYFTKRCWWVFLLVGVAASVASLFVEEDVCSVLLGVFSFSCFWSIFELFEQEKRVEKGWFPRNPKRAAPSEKK